MLGSLLQGVGTQLATRWAAQVAVPALLFWSGALGAWLLHADDGGSNLETFINDRSSAVLLLLSVGVLWAIVASGVVVRLLARPFIRGLSGYWLAPLRFFADWLRERRSEKLDELRKKWNELSEPKTWKEKQQYVSLDIRLRKAPTDASERMPTRLGNLLRAGELRPRDKYGLDSVICWPRLWALLPEAERDDLEHAQSQFFTAAEVMLFGLLFCVWVIWSKFAVLAGLAVAIGAYVAVLRLATVYLELVESAFDLHRQALYQALRWPLPATPHEEQEQGKKLTEYLWRGSGDHEPTFSAE